MPKKTTLRRLTSLSHPPLWYTPGETWSTGFHNAGCCGHIPNILELRDRWRCLPAGRSHSWEGHTPEKGKEGVTAEKKIFQDFVQLKMSSTDLPPSVLCQEGSDPSSDPRKPNQKLAPQTAPSFWGSTHQMHLQLTGPIGRGSTLQA